MATSDWVVVVLFFALLIQGQIYNGNHKRILSSNIVALQKIETSMKAAGRNVQNSRGLITEYIMYDNGSSEVKAVGPALEKVSLAVSKFTTAKTLKIVSGVLDTISSITVYIPKVGPAVSAAFKVIAGILDAVGNLFGEDYGSIVREEIERALNRYDDSQLRAEAEGTMRVYRISHAYLSAMVGNTTINEHEIPTMAAHVPIYGGVKFLGILQYKVTERLNSTNVDHVKQAMEYTNLYVTLAVLRSGILWEMYSIVRSVPNFERTAEAIRRVAQSEERTDIDFLKYLSQPDYSRSFFFAYFNPSEWPIIETFYAKKGLSFQKLDHLLTGTHYLSPEKWPDWYMYMMDEEEAWIAGTKHRGDNSRFYFNPVSQNDNIFYMRSEKWPDWYVYMQDDEDGTARGLKGTPGQEGQWKIVKYGDGKHLISPRKWPNWFIYMTDSDEGNVRGREGDPGPKGHWIIE